MGKNNRGPEILESYYVRRSTSRSGPVPPRRGRVKARIFKELSEALASTFIKQYRKEKEIEEGNQCSSSRGLSQLATFELLPTEVFPRDERDSLIQKILALSNEDHNLKLLMDAIEEKLGRIFRNFTIPFSAEVLDRFFAFGMRLRSIITKSNNLGTNPWIHHPLSPNVRQALYLHLNGYPSRPLALTFREEILVDLNLSYSKKEQLWAGKQHLVSLKFVDLTYSKLSKTPDFSEAHNIRRLNLQDCVKLVELSSIQHLTKLEYLNFRGCISLRSLPIFADLKNLSSLHVADCSNLNGLPLSMAFLSDLTTLDLRNCGRLQHLPANMMRCRSLKTVDISGCSKLLECASGNETKEVFALPWSLLSSSLEVSVSFSSIIQEGMSTGTQLLQDSSSASFSGIGSMKKDDEESTESEAGKGTSFAITQPLLAMPPDEQEATSSHTQYPAKILSRSQAGGSSLNSWKSAVAHSSGLCLHWKALEQYMDMSVEDIHEAGAFKDVEQVVNDLMQQTSLLQDRTNMEEFLCCLAEFKQSITDTMTCMKAAQRDRTSLEVKARHLGACLSQAREQFSSLESERRTLAEEEANLEAEIQSLMAKKEDHRNQKQINQFSSKEMRDQKETSPFWSNIFVQSVLCVLIITLIMTLKSKLEGSY